MQHYIIDIHGGGGNVYGSKELYQHYCLGWARHGFGVVNFNYRLAPQTIFPGALKDTALIAKWVADHGQDYHLDTNNVFIIGDSAGGTLAYQYLTAYANPKYRKALGLVSSGQLVVRGGALNSGCYFVKRPGAITPDSLMSAYFTPEMMQKYDQGVRFDHFLLDHHLAHRFASFGTESDPREHVFQLNQRDAVAAKANQQQGEFFRSLFVEK
ncbi:alpha/beta hydrolase [Lactobacillus reuteri]|uniref:alpha/beta hydrolase n=1 Tax=Limosilactobacillus reuteri TaxID=1598 RepID=UPI00146A9446|nr:alpha/beta hydrolase fold domain-containing protein [Limosilactobacillus reuteri]NMV49548.1 alpha/beta hydrolase [Limosilactobacillus reuteri]NMV51205.1 alpha/beta hydrolase [Limosilactobacillus reuteri]NMV60341.1 alpha/beta hydrolase [Limosilactobacillus reuteri]NMV62145.1 alpha/beta hydrolase [Limosilactobacillus reuteri]NMV63918.1 alpha/beta hydrolase [Limosilactobacillus reuteri]